MASNVGYSMPCYNCDYAYSCRYFKAPEWIFIILSYKICPVAYGFPFEASSALISQIQSWKNKSTNLVL